jgi:hypothetical protein
MSVSVVASGTYYAITVSVGATSVILTDPAITGPSGTHSIVGLMNSWNSAGTFGIGCQFADAVGHFSTSTPPAGWTFASKTTIKANWTAIMTAIALWFSHADDWTSTQQFSGDWADDANGASTWQIIIPHVAYIGGPVSALFFSLAYWFIVPPPNFAVYPEIRFGVAQAVNAQIPPPSILVNGRRSIIPSIQRSTDGATVVSGPVDLDGFLVFPGNPSSVDVECGPVSSWLGAVDMDVDLADNQSIFTVVGRTFTFPGSK